MHHAVLFSNYGATSVDLGAPGVNIVSTVPDNSYAGYNGTSMATPHVTGAIGLYAAGHVGQTAQQIKSAILNAARNTPTASLASITSTGGRLNLGDLFSGTVSEPTPAPAPPTPPTGLRVTAATRARVDLAWTDASNNETGFKVERSSDGAYYTQIGLVGAGVVSYADTSLPRRKGSWYYRVRAYNTGGDSAYSNVAATN
jgi:subtilisin family serine protease